MDTTTKKTSSKQVQVMDAFFPIRIEQQMHVDDDDYWLHSFLLLPVFKINVLLRFIIIVHHQYIPASRCLMPWPFIYFVFFF